MAMNRYKQKIVGGEESWIKGVVVIVHDSGKSGPAKSVSLQFYSATELDHSEPSFFHLSHFFPFIYIPFLIVQRKHIII